jgi:virulence-associated protein VagC
MQRTAKIIMNSRPQAARLPKEIQFSTTEAFTRKQGEEDILLPRPKDWSELLKRGRSCPDRHDECF